MVVLGRFILWADRENVGDSMLLAVLEAESRGQTATRTGSTPCTPRRSIYTHFPRKSCPGTISSALTEPANMSRERLRQSARTASNSELESNECRRVRSEESTGFMSPPAGNQRHPARHHPDIPAREPIHLHAGPDHDARPAMLNAVTTHVHYTHIVEFDFHLSRLLASARVSLSDTLPLLHTRLCHYVLRRLAPVQGHGGRAVRRRTRREA